MKTYKVPALVYGSFGCELEVRASSPEEAKQKVIEGDGQLGDGDSYDWSRWVEYRHKIGYWQPVKVVEGES